MQIRKFELMFLFMAVFYGIAIAMWQFSGGIFYLFNFTYIGTAIALGMGLFPILPKNRKQIARRISQVLIKENLRERALLQKHKYDES